MKGQAKEKVVISEKGLIIYCCNKVGKIGQKKYKKIKK